MIVVPKLQFESTRRAAKEFSSPKEINNIKPAAAMTPMRERIGLAGYMSMQSGSSSNRFMSNTRNRHQGTVPVLEKKVSKQERTQSELRQIPKMEGEQTLKGNPMATTI